jgi:hypothetical protein
MAENTDRAGYFRVWQGFHKIELSNADFLGSLASFMKATVDIYKERALNNYIVIIPPATKPSFIPDELALVALNSKENYDLIRATPEGKAYSAHHWDIFERTNSQSAPLINYCSERPDSLISQTAYDVLGAPTDWSSGYNTVFIGTKKSSLSSTEFLKRLQRHIENAKAVMAPKGLKGYIVIANENYEVAYLNWESKQAHDSAGLSDGGRAVFAEANEIMDVLMYQQAKSFNAGEAVSAGEAYSNLQK